MPRGNQKQPIELIIAKGKKHLTKAEIEERMKIEVKVNYTDVKPPEYLTEEQQKEFVRIANILLDVGIISELDEDCLAHYLIANTNYIYYTEEIEKLKIKIQKEKNIAKKQEYMGLNDLYIKYQNTYSKQCRAYASDLGLTISSRCKLVMPPTKEETKENKFAKFKVVGK